MSCKYPGNRFTQIWWIRKYRVYKQGNFAFRVSIVRAISRSMRRYSNLVPRFSRSNFGIINRKFKSMMAIMAAAKVPSSDSFQSHANAAESLNLKNFVIAPKRSWDWNYLLASLQTSDQGTLKNNRQFFSMLALTAMQIMAFVLSRHLSGISVRSKMPSNQGDCVRVLAALNQVICRSITLKMLF